MTAVAPGLLRLLGLDNRISSPFIPFTRLHRFLVVHLVLYKDSFEAFLC